MSPSLKSLTPWQLTVVVLAVLSVVSMAGSALAEINSAQAPVNWTPVLMKPSAAPRPFEGSDGSTNLVYEVTLTNFSSSPTKIIEFQVLDQDAQPLLSLTGDKLKQAFTTVAKPQSDTLLTAGAMGTVWVNIALPNANNVPGKLAHRIVWEMQAPKPKTGTNIGCELAVDQVPPIHIAPPLSGGKWVAHNGYGLDSHHRRALYPIDNNLANAQRFAIDWMMLDDKDRASTGDPFDVHSSPGYGQPVLAVADGTVAGVIDRFHDQRPGQPSGDKAFPGGNSIIIALPDGVYAFYAHLKPDSIKVKTGDSVSRGQVIAQVGNTGNSTDPHLHFQITDKPYTLGANSIPYVIDSFTLNGEITDERRFVLDCLNKRPITMTRPQYVGDHHNQLPKEGSVVTFAK